MDKIKWIRGLSLVGAIVSAVTLGLNGQVAEGVAVVFAALSSTGILKSQ